MARSAVWVADEGGNTVTVIDAATHRRLKTIEGVMGPHNVQAAPDGKAIWSTSGHGNEVVVIDPASYRVRARIGDARGGGGGPVNGRALWAMKVSRSGQVPLKRFRSTGRARRSPIPCRCNLHHLQRGGTRDRHRAKGFPAKSANPAAGCGGWPPAARRERSG